MKLNEFMKTADPNTVYHIGSYTGFMFVGTPSDYERDFGAVSKAVMEWCDTSIKRMENMIASMTAETPEKKARSASRKKKLRWNIKELRNMPYLGNREVKEVYKRTTGGYAVIIAGSESGRFWTLDEYRRSRTKCDPIQSTMFPSM